MTPHLRFVLSAVVLLGSLAGCKKVPTSMVLTITRMPGSVRPDLLEVRVMDHAGLLIQPQRILKPEGETKFLFPGTLYFDLAPESGEVAVVIWGVQMTMFGDEYITGGYTGFIPVLKDKQILASLEIGPGYIVDVDSDRIPDDIDNCPGVSNADQKSTDRKVGDRCRSGAPDAGGDAKTDTPPIDGPGDSGDAAGGAGGDAGDAAVDPPTDPMAAPGDVDNCTLFADDFEGGALTSWQKIEGMVGLAGVGAIAGAFSAEAISGGAPAYLEANLVRPADKVRLSFQLRASTSKLTPTMTALRLRDNMGGTAVTLLMGPDGAGVNLQMLAQSQFGPVSSPVVPISGTARILFEWAAGNTSVRLEVNGAERLNMAVSNSVIARATGFTVGAVQLGGATDAVTLVLDDFVATSCF